MKTVKLLSLTLLVLIFIGLLPGRIFAQTTGNTADIIPAPGEETFQKVDALGTWWYYSSNCYESIIETKAFETCNSLPLRAGGYDKKVLIYNSDGSVWFDFYMDGKGAGERISEKAEDGFAPLSGQLTTQVIKFPAGDKDNYSYNYLIFRMTGEPRHWYEVEVNENTQELRYLPKDAPMMWAKVSWDHWLLSGGGDDFGTCSGNCIRVDKDHRELLRDKPNGKIIEPANVYTENRMYFIKRDGDWAYVKAYIPDSKRGVNFPEEFRGWIRWRDGRNFLVGCVFNHYKIKAAETDQASLLKP